MSARRWDRERVVLAARIWARTHGDRAPTHTDWNAAGDLHPGRATVNRLFGPGDAFAALAAAAGLAAPPDRAAALAAALRLGSTVGRVPDRAELERRCRHLLSAGGELEREELLQLAGAALSLASTTTRSRAA